MSKLLKIILEGKISILIHHIKCYCIEKKRRIQVFFILKIVFQK